jgi:hypothetical protein
MSDWRHGESKSRSSDRWRQDYYGVYSAALSNNENIGVMGEVRHGIRVGKCPTSRKAHED